MFLWVLVYVLKSCYTVEFFSMASALLRQDVTACAYVTMLSPITTGSDDLPASCTSMTFPCGDLLLLSLAPTVAD